MRAILLVTVVLSVAFAAPGHAGDDVMTILDEACDGEGFAGTMLEGKTAVGFVSCKTNDGAFSTISDGTGQVQSEVVLIAGDKPQITIRIGGVEWNDSTTEASLKEMQQAIDATDPELVTKRLWSELVELGKDPRSPEMAALAAHLVVYEGFVSATGDCFGCCGWGCVGCTGCYTAACYAHDACVRSLGHGNQTCQKLVVVAALSAWECVFA